MGCEARVPLRFVFGAALRRQHGPFLFPLPARSGSRFIPGPVPAAGPRSPAQPGAAAPSAARPGPAARVTRAAAPAEPGPGSCCCFPGEFCLRTCGSGAGVSVCWLRLCCRAGHQSVWRSTPCALSCSAGEVQRIYVHSECSVPQR